MDRVLKIELGDRPDLAWAQETVARHHYLHWPVEYRARPMVYVVRKNELCVALVMLGIPHATRCAGPADHLRKRFAKLRQNAVNKCVGRLRNHRVKAPVRSTNLLGM